MAILETSQKQVTQAAGQVTGPFCQTLRNVTVSTRRALKRYVAIPLAFASAAAAVMAAIVVVSRMTGYQGKFQPTGTPVPFVEAWTDVPLLAVCFSS